jgi:DNA-binding MarR family transcriptional regulator
MRPLPLGGAASPLTKISFCANNRGTNHTHRLAIAMRTLSNMDDLIVAAIRRIIRAVDLYSHWLAEEHGLTGPQLAVLRAAAQHPAMTPGRLAAAVHLSRSTVTGIVDRLEVRGLVVRSRNAKDRRSVVLSVTEKGEDLLKAAPPLLQDRLRNELGELKEWERIAILSTLQRIATIMDAEDIDASPVLVPGPVDATVSETTEETAVSASIPSGEDADAEQKGKTPLSILLPVDKLP